MSDPRLPQEILHMSDTGWHLDRRVPISIIIVLFIQTLAFISAGAWYIGMDQQWKQNVEYRLANIPHVIPPAIVESRLATLEANQRNIESNQNNILDSLRDISRQLHIQK